MMFQLVHQKVEGFIYKRFNAGTVLKINATPDDGYKFIGWTGSNETSMEITITVNSNISLQAIFSKIFSYNSEIQLCFNFYYRKYNHFFQ